MKYRCQLGVLILFSCISCGASNKTVRYVYVNQPVYSPQPVQESRPNSEYVNNSEVLSQYRSAEPRTYSNPSASHTESVNNSYGDSGVSASRAQQGKSPFVLANTYVYGAYRGYGEGESTSMTAAYKMATNRAGQDALEKISVVIESISNDVVESLNSAGMESFKQELKTYTRAAVRNVKVVATERTRGQINRVEHCVEISASDVIESIAPILEKLNAADRKRVEETIRKANEELK